MTDKTRALEKLASTPAQYNEERDSTQPIEGIDYGIVVLPPVMGETNEEIDSYPADYIEYAQDRLREYKREHGELPRYAKEVKP